jgi:hypothetical protein
MTPPTPSALTQRLQTALLERLHVHEQDGTLPTSARFLFYELEGKSDAYGILVSKEQKGARRPDQDLISALTVLREKGLVPWDWITDETRHVAAIYRAKTLVESLTRALKYAKTDIWQFGTHRPVVICESRSLAGVLGGVCSEYGVTIAATNGQCAGFLRTKLAEAFDSQPNEQTVSVLYCGDLDPQGEDIEENNRRVLTECVTLPFDWERLMLSPEQVKEHSLEFIWKKDGRKKKGGKYKAWECEALSQKLIVALLRSQLEEMLLPKTLDSIAEREADERRRVKVVAV